MIQAGTAINPGNSGGALVNDIGLVATKIAAQLLDK
jgi:S1-C subfamily serine protease